MDPGLTPHQKRRTWHPIGDLAGTSRLPGISRKHRFAPGHHAGIAASTKDETREELKTKWSTASTTQNFEGPLALKQSAWDKPLLDKIVADLLDRQPEHISQARFKAISAPHAGDWLLARLSPAAVSDLMTRCSGLVVTVVGLLKQWRWNE